MSSCFQLLLLRHVSSVATHLRCGGIFSDNIITIYKCSPDSDSKIILKICQYLMKLRRMKLRRTKSVPVFLGHPVYSNAIGPCEMWMVLKLKRWEGGSVVVHRVGLGIFWIVKFWVVWRRSVVNLKAKNNISIAPISGHVSWSNQYRGYYEVH